MDALTLAVLALLVAGVVGSVVPVLPGAVLSLAGLAAYWLFGAGEVWWVWLVLLGLLAALAAVFDVVATTVAARRGGSSTRAAGLGLVVGFLLLVPLGPFGLPVGIAGTVFAVEYRHGQSAEDAARAAAYATVGVLASNAVQTAITVVVLVAFAGLLFA